MVKRSLTEEEQRLWQLYTRDIAPSEKIDLNVQRCTPRFEIKIPDHHEFRKTNPPSVSNFESLKNSDSNWSKKLKQGKLKVEGKIDLHGLTCVQAHEKLWHFLERAQNNGKRLVLVVTGKGGLKGDYGENRYQDFENNRGALRREVPMWLSGGAMRQMIVTFQDAASRDGGAGALYVILKRK